MSVFVCLQPWIVAYICGWSTRPSGLPLLCLILIQHNIINIIYCYVGCDDLRKPYYCHMRVSLCHEYDDIVNITNIISRTSSPLLIYRDVGKPLRVTCEWSYVLPNENTNCKNKKMLQSCFACYEQPNWPKHVCIISLYMHGMRYYVAVIGFPRTVHAATYQ